MCTNKHTDHLFLYYYLWYYKNNSFLYYNEIIDIFTNLSMERRFEGDFVLMKMTTLCYIENNDCYLMLHRTKKKKDVNKDKWIGVGGHAEGNETPQECLLREVKEETGLLLTSYKFRGLITFISDEYEAEMMCLFTADGYTGELITCDEGELEWVKKSDVPQLPTWEGDAQFLKLLLEDEKRFFAMKLRYEGERLVEKSVEFCGG